LFVATGKLLVSFGCPIDTKPALKTAEESWMLGTKRGFLGNFGVSLITHSPIDGKHPITRHAFGPRFFTHKTTPINFFFDKIHLLIHFEMLEFR
jgi:hypothetical protein